MHFKGRDTFACLPTGYGKSFIFASPWETSVSRETTPSIAGQTSLYKLLSPQKRKVPNRNKTNSSIKPNKFHSKYVCFAGRKTNKYM